MNAHTDIPTETRADWIADHRRIVARTEGELNQRARDVKAHLDVLAQHQQPAYRDDVTAALGELAYPLGTYRDCPAIHYSPMSDTEWAEELMVLGATLQAREPRKWAAILRATRLDRAACVIWFELPVEPDDIPYGAAA